MTLRVLALGAIAGVALSSRAAADGAVDFRADVLPILSDTCFACHGPDEGQRKGKFRLDTLDGATGPTQSGKAAIVPGEPQASELVRRIFAEHADELMPPPDFKRPLTDAQKQTLRQWIAQGAQYRKHWAYEVPVRPALPLLRAATVRERNAIDHFIFARLEREGLSPSPQADRYTLIRRVTLDLTGLPPSIEEVDAFIADRRADAYERLVDRLLQVPAFGEHFGRHWLDLARYADSNGYHVDTPRHIWAYRQWVIQAINRNMPFDQFTIEQIAGDLLSDATPDQKIATGFHRNTMFNEEGGIDEEEFRTKAVVDRVGTTMTVWMGATMMCAECHTHKYDPLTHKEFFQLYAFFNNVPETGGGFTKKPVPLVDVPMTDEARAQLAVLDKQLEHLKAQPEPEDKSESDKHKQRLAGIETQIAALNYHFTTPVMQEMETPRETRIHIRGNFMDLGEAVEPGVPAVFHPLNVRGERPTRLDLAHWLVDEANPLTARVVVNRYWQMLFGAGLVRTPEEFGTRGELPSHPDLLDWLAREFTRTGWDVKRLVRLIVTSATYRQSPAATPERRIRLDAEAIRDTALAVSGLLDRRIGGPSVYPLQPAGLWEEKGLGAWPTSTGRDLYRRGLYTYVRRSVPYPASAVFDAPSREYCIVSRSRTNTPLQAMVTLNGPQFIEAARAMAQRIVRGPAARGARGGPAGRCAARAAGLLPNPHQRSGGTGRGPDQRDRAGCVDRGGQRAAEP
jgi:hypothetical protein